MTPGDHAKTQVLGWGAAALFVLCAAFFVLRLTGPSDLMDGDQWRSSAYVMDIVKNGEWVVQRDQRGNIASKPPLQPWLSAIVSHATGDVSEFSLRLPSALAVFGLGVLVMVIGAGFFGPAAGVLGGASVIVSSVGLKMIGQVRTDPLFGLAVFACAWLVFLAWERRGGWTRAWIVGAAATLTKGPLGLVLAGMGLIAAFWERRTGARAPVRGPHAVGVALYLVICGGWFAAAYATAGHAFIDKVIFSELVGHASQSSKGSVPGQEFYKAPTYLATRYLPWFLFAAVGVWRVVRMPSEDDRTRRFERFVVCALLGGLALFCLSPHIRGDIVYPLVPFAALLAGREMSLWIAGWRRETLVGAAAVVLAVSFVGAYAKYHVVVARDHRVIKSEAMRAFAGTMREALDREGWGLGDVVFVESPALLQHHLRVLRPHVEAEESARLIVADGARLVVIGELDPLREALDGEGLAGGLRVIAETRVDARPLRLVVWEPEDASEPEEIAGSRASRAAL